MILRVYAKQRRKTNQPIPKMNALLPIAILQQMVQNSQRTTWGCIRQKLWGYYYTIFFLLYQFKNSQSSELYINAA